MHQQRRQHGRNSRSRDHPAEAVRTVSLTQKGIRHTTKQQRASRRPRRQLWPMVQCDRKMQPARSSAVASAESIAVLTKHVPVPAARRRNVAGSAPRAGNRTRAAPTRLTKTTVAPDPRCGRMINANSHSSAGGEQQAQARGGGTRPRFAGVSGTGIGKPGKQIGPLRNQKLKQIRAPGPAGRHRPRSVASAMRNST